MNKTIISTDKAPAAIGPYSQAVKVADTVYISGQIPLNPDTMKLVGGGFKEQAEQVFCNLSAVAEAAGGSLNNAVKLNVYVTDLSTFDDLNHAMAAHFSQPYPARAAIQVAALPKGASIEIDAVLCLTK